MNKGSLHLEIQRHRKSCYGLLRTTYWDKKAKKIKHTSHGRLTGLEHETLKLIQAALKGKARLATDADFPRATNSKEYGASFAVLQLAKELELDKAIYSRSPLGFDSLAFRRLFSLSTQAVKIAR